MTQLETAERLAALGFSVIPIDHPEDSREQDPDRVGKVPVVSWKPWQQTRPGAENLRAWFGNGKRRNLGIVTGHISGIVVVDLDSPTALAWAMANLPATPLRVSTRQGEHWYYRHPGRDISNAVRVTTPTGETLELDIRGDGGYVVAPSSTHASGHVYRAPTPWPPSIDSVPVFQSSWFGDSAPATGASRETDPDDETGAHIIGEGQRDSTLTSIAGSMRRRGLQPSEIEAALRLVNERRCRPPLTAEDITRIAASVGRYPATAPSTTPLTLVSLRQLLDEPELPVAWVVDQRVPSAGVVLLVGKPKAGKSTAARGLALAVARGESWLGCPCEPGRVWYLAVEEKRDEVRRHFRQMGATGDEPLELFVQAAPIDIVAQLHDLATRQRPSLIVLDTVVRCLSLRDINDYAEVTRKFDPLLALARSTGAALVLVHHAGKSRAGEAVGIDSILGSTALSGSVDNVLILSRTERFRTLCSIQRIGPDLPETLVLLDDCGRVKLGDTRDAAEREAAAAAILDVLDNSDHPDGLTETEILDRVEVRTAVAKAALRFSFRDNRIGRNGNGRKGNPFRYTTISRSHVPLEGREPENHKCLVRVK